LGAGMAGPAGSCSPPSSTCMRWADCGRTAPGTSWHPG
jgi:hypothetical protein